MSLSHFPQRRASRKPIGRRPPQKGWYVDPALSPDGKFLAYASTGKPEEDAEEVYVASYPGPGGKWKVGAGKFRPGRRRPMNCSSSVWDDRIMAATYSIQGEAFSAGPPRPWSQTKIRRNSVQQNFDVSPDGEHAVIFPSPESEVGAGTLHATFVLNFFVELRRKLPVGGR